MAAAYAALVTLTHTMEQIMEHHARRQIFLDKQRRQIESLQQKVSFLQHFLEVYSNGGSNEGQGLASRIADAAYAAQDIIESHVVYTILPQAPKRGPKKKKNEKVNFISHGRNSSNHFSQSLQKVIEHIDCIRKTVIEIKGKKDDQQPRDVMPVVLSRSPVTEKDTMMEYYDEDLEQIMDKLTGQSSNLQIISIIGMGGIGKTTLARNIYDNLLIVEYFSTRAWITVSQEYNLRELLLGLLHEMGVVTNNRKQESSEYHQLGETLHKHLSGRKYIIIMDDIWSIEVCEKLKLFLPNNNNGSRVMLTTRLSNVAEFIGSSHIYKMNFLDENKSWNLLCKKVFGHVNCPSELEEVGKDIAKNCQGLPLSIVVIGGLLAKSEMTRKYWEYVAKYISQIINTEDDGHWLRILSLSYSHLPIHLKPCFLYLGGYPEDSEIRVSKLIKLWVAEGFLKPNKAKSLEEVGEDYLKDLVERNLIFVRKWGSIGKMKTCGIHDLLRDLSLKEAQKEMFLCVVKTHNHAQPVNNVCRIVFHEDLSHDQRSSHQFHQVLQSTPFMRSLTCGSFHPSSVVHNHRLLRVLNVGDTCSLQSNIFQLANLRYLNCGDDLHLGGRALLSSVFRLCCLQTLILTGYNEVEHVAPNEIWEMAQLRHIKMKNLSLPDLLDGQINQQNEHEDFVLKNLQTLMFIENFKCSEWVLKRIPNIKKLWINNPKPSKYYCLHNLGRLYKLQSLYCRLSRGTDLFQNLVFPQSLRKLILYACRFDWDDFTEKVGSLPHLEKLKLDGCYTSADWNTIDGKFLRLSTLEINSCESLVRWTGENSHFPCLERLILKSIFALKEIPSGIGETLQSITLVFCDISVLALATDMLEEQRSLGNEGLQLKEFGTRDILEVPRRANRWAGRSLKEI